MKNNLILGAVGGAIAAIIGGGIWAAITVTTGWQIGFMAIGVGILVGLAVRLLGKGETQLFGFMGGFLALIGCLLGNLFTGIALRAGEFGTGFMETFMKFDFSTAPGMLGAMFSPIDLLFYGIAVWEGFKFSVHKDGISS